MSKHLFYRRLFKEYKELQKDALPGIKLVSHEEDLTNFIFRVKADHKTTIYPDSEIYHLNIKITPDYPVDSPSVKFILYKAKQEVIDLTTDDDDEDEDGDDDAVESVIENGEPKIPIHPHIYSNGHICLNLLGEDWSPACSIETIVLSIQSMLNTNNKNERPPDNASYVSHAPKDPKLSSFAYHDDTV
ncbi:ubiquitin-conjugating enzyme/RWD-like protein [Scheffersomyces coipomensis]|uniref:ubiquitin-conjugating enzyme/RWD-like protein n=1 Tax=Scheffersomyces coipomensis TaxID=1788519 RepID=UPI00315DA801